MPACPDCGYDHDKRSRQIKDFYTRVVPVMALVTAIVALFS